MSSRLTSVPLWLLRTRLWGPTVTEAPARLPSVPSTCLWDPDVTWAQDFSPRFNQYPSLGPGCYVSSRLPSVPPLFLLPWLHVAISEDLENIADNSFPMERYGGICLLLAANPCIGSCYIWFLWSINMIALIFPMEWSKFFCLIRFAFSFPYSTKRFLKEWLQINWMSDLFGITNFNCFFFHRLFAQNQIIPVFHETNKHHHQ